MLLIRAVFFLLKWFLFRYLLAVGLETGEILFVTFNSSDFSWSHPLAINRLYPSLFWAGLVVLGTGYSLIESR